MKLTDFEVAVLQALAHLPADSGDGVSVRALRSEIRTMSQRQVHEVLHSLREKNLVKMAEDQQSAAIAEAGVAALASV